MASALHTVEATGVGRWMRESVWAYPITETVHIAGLALLFGSIAIVDLRLVGLGRKVPVSALVAYAVPWSLAGFVVAASTGLLMFSAHASEFISQRVFLLKMGLILAAGVNAAILHTGPMRVAREWDVGVSPPPKVQIAAMLSLAIWLGVITCGRMLAYL